MSGNRSTPRHVLASKRQGAVTFNNIAHQESIPLGLVCCSGTQKTRAARRKRDGAPRVEEGVSLLEKENCRERKSRIENGDKEIGLVEMSHTQIKLPLKSCLRHSKNGDTEAYVIANPSVGEEPAIAPLAQLSNSSPCSNSNHPLSTSSSIPEVSPRFLASRSGSSISLPISSKQQIMRTTSYDQRNGARLTNGQVSFHGIQTKKDTMES